MLGKCILTCCSMACPVYQECSKNQFLSGTLEALLHQSLGTLNAPAFSILEVLMLERGCTVQSQAGRWHSWCCLRLQMLLSHDVSVFSEHNS